MDTMPGSCSFPMVWVTLWHNSSAHPKRVTENSEAQARSARSIPAAKLGVSFPEMKFQGRLFVRRARPQARTQEVDGVSRPIGANRNQSQVAALLVRRGGKRRQAVLHHPGGGPIPPPEIEGLEVIWDAGYDRSGPGGPERR